MKVQELFVDTIQKTIVTYLLPIDSPITQFSTTAEVLAIVQEQAKKYNMPFVNIAFDIGAAVDAYKVLWNQPEGFENIIIHSGNFHKMKEIFAVMGKLISGSGFEEIIFQSGLCSSGSLNGVVSDSHYNRCWTVHSHLAEALEQLLLKKFLNF